MIQQENHFGLTRGHATGYSVWPNDKGWRWAAYGQDRFGSVAANGLSETREGAVDTALRTLKVWDT